ncbi:MAG: sigma 54-interacting transcriptional regulator [Desulfobulbaceae bacterium]|nr:sigma 54-interacting transcriptional regulator [Desulfobulbaceae bacterium]
MEPPTPAEYDTLIIQLQDRIKELDCIYAICRIAANSKSDFDQIIQDITDRIAPAFRNPESTCVCIAIGNKVTKTSNFKSCRFKLTEDIIANEKILGRLEVGYLGVLQQEECSPFKEEDRKLLHTIAARIGIFLHANILKDSLNKSEKQYRTLVDNALVGISQTNLTGELLYANNTYLRMFGYKCLKDAISAGCLNHYRSVEDRDNFVAMLKETGKVADFEAECVTRTGEKIAVLFSAILEADVITTMMMDISERKRACENLTKSEMRLAEAQRIAQLGNWDWDIVTGELYWSDEIIRNFGIHPRQFDATHEEFLHFVHPDDRQTVREAVNQSLSQPGKTYSIEHRLLHPDGRENVVQLRGEVTFGRNREPIRMFGTVHDITERKQAEMELRKAFDEIKELKEKLVAENIYLRDELELKDGNGDIIGTSDPIKYVKYRSRMVARTKATILLTGETGTGKNLFARFIHLESDRRDKPLVNVNCAGLPANLIESELFGREKGAFTGSTARQIGRFELANNGTIFLDEIGELPLDLQAKLLKVIDDGEFERLGSPHTVKVNVRIIASTNRNLEMEMRRGRFRKDLFYRLSVFPITIPPLRQRKEDIPLLVTYFTRKFRKAYHKNIQRIPAEIMDAFVNYSWPGNVRELINIIERALIVSNGPELRLAETIGDTFVEPAPDNITTEDRNADETEDLLEVEKEHIHKSLRRTGWRIEGPQGAAQLLGLNPSTMRARMRKLGIRRPGV